MFLSTTCGASLKRELRGTMHWDDSGDWTEDDIAEVG
jgi:hypothetical protein